MVHACADGGHVVGNFVRRRRDPILQTGTQRVEARVEFGIDKRRGAWKVIRAGELRAKLRAAKRREEQATTEVFDRVIIQLVVEREAIEVLVRASNRRLDVEDDFMR